MTGEQKNLVKESFEKLEPLAEEAGVLFYARLFELDPELRPLFKGGIREQGLKLMQMIGLAVASIDRIDELLPAVRSLGAQHAEYGVEDRHYDTVAEALLWTLEKALEPVFPAETKEAWAAIYGLLAETMKDAASQNRLRATGSGT